MHSVERLNMSVDAARRVMKPASTIDKIRMRLRSNCQLLAKAYCCRSQELNNNFKEREKLLYRWQVSETLPRDFIKANREYGKKLA